MRYLKYTTYVYLFFGLYFVYDGIVKLSHEDTTYWLSFAIAAMGIAMFFVRRRFAKKMEDRNKKS
ncbi:hypothetical protein [Flavobacterium agrisoli]|uniref:LPXTG-motif cell wall-anchored protein n=1 Tax=Flavobacterium agrisoli TaxID=2793066 RepID=A0A934PQE1_9FLAO|nr:hypothetical protein [Flavobacterium agrisoli]MBK0370686.1 hypothetical protein [Flavobacterium agrisoli]